MFKKKKQQEVERNQEQYNRERDYSVFIKKTIKELIEQAGSDASQIDHL